MMRRFVHIHEDLSKLMWDDRLSCAAKRKKGDVQRCMVENIGLKKEYAR
jgi:hypothetical protein